MFIYVYRDKQLVHAVGRIATYAQRAPAVYTFCDDVETRGHRGDAVTIQLMDHARVTCLMCRAGLDRRRMQGSPIRGTLNWQIEHEDVDQQLAEALDRKFNRPKPELTDTEMRFSLLELD